MENVTKPKVRVKHLDRVSLSLEAVTRLNEWMTSLEMNARGIRISKNDLVNFLILHHSAELSEKEMAQLRDQYFDEVRFAEWAIKELKRAKASGKSLTLNQVLGESKRTENTSEISREKERK